MKKSIFILIITGIFLRFNAYSQNNPRMENPDYAVTVFDDDFEGNWRDNWKPSSGGYISPNFGVILIWVDSTATIHQDKNIGELYLTALESENYWGSSDNGPITADNISGEVRSKDRFLYGVFECNATFGYKHGSFPAFWLFFDTVCEYDYGSEIDIVELKYEEDSTGLDNNAFYYPCAAGGFEGVTDAFKDNEFDWSTGMAHTFKCIWTPTKTEWYVDNSLLHTIYNTGDNHYPNKTMDIRLSQQLFPYNEEMDDIDVPVTSTFHWVRAKQFFLAPEITISSDVICTTGSAIMDVDPDATNITWQLSPTNLFSGTTSGTGKTASISVNPSASGQGKITYSFDMPSGNTFESFEAEKAFWVGDPLPSDISLVVMGNLTGQQVNQYMMCPNTGYILICQNSNNQCNTSNYSWFLPYGMSLISTSGNTAYINTNSSPGGILTVKAQTCCSANATIMSEVLDTDVDDCDGWYMSFSPNPTTGETTLTIESESKEKVFDEGIVWEYEVYNTGQRLKTKQTKIRGSSTIIQTQSWKEGNYVVHIKFSPDGKTEKILTGKLMVKK